MPSNKKKLKKMKEKWLPYMIREQFKCVLKAFIHGV